MGGRLDALAQYVCTMHKEYEYDIKSSRKGSKIKVWNLYSS